MMKILVIDNGGQWTHREWRVLKYLGADAFIVPNTTPCEEIDCDGLVLSGGSPRIRTENTLLGNTNKYLDYLKIPILGICVGAQYIAVHYGGEAGPAEIPEYGKTLCYIDEHNEIFEGLPTKIVVWESHNDEIKNLPKNSIKLAHSENCDIQAFKYGDKIYGVQFHPEVEHTEYGYEIFKNFMKLCRR